MRILVAGGAGFIGSNLCKKLLENTNNYVICMDNFSSGKWENIEKMKNNRRFEIITHDIVNPVDIEVEQIYNAACQASPRFYQVKSLETFDTCILGTRNLLNIAKKNDAKFLQLSTSEVYGNPIEHPQNERYYGNVNTTGTRACYDEGKRAAETLCYLYNKEYKTKTKIVRIFNTYGPNMRSDDGRVIPSFVSKALKNENIEIFGDGEQTRSLCYIDDLIDGLVKMMELDENIKTPVNLGNSDEITINELAKRIIKLTNSKSKIIYKEAREDDPIKRRPDLSLAKKILNYTPTSTIDEGLKKMIEYYQN